MSQLFSVQDISHKKILPPTLNFLHKISIFGKKIITLKIEVETAPIKSSS